jgi:hypothetical protein
MIGNALSVGKIPNNTCGKTNIKISYLLIIYQLELISGSNLKHVAGVIGGCNLVGYLFSAAVETHKITDLVST